MTDTMTTVRPSLPGRLGDPGMTLATDPRSDPRMVAVLEPLGMAGRADPVPLTADSSLDDIRALAALGEPGFQQVFNGMFEPLAPVEGVESST
ncbi:MAG: alpha/beta hydrolase, partial [Acidimicrobiaceae bacterium]|nr:alpha/beta hydrolase [Acidimicrobiaceae bacterium]